MKDIIMHYELPGKIGLGNYKTDSVGEVIEILSRLKQAVDETPTPIGVTILGIEWHVKPNAYLDDTPSAASITCGIHILASNRNFSGLVDAVLSKAGVPDHLSTKRWGESSENLQEIFNIMNCFLGQYGKSVLEGPKEEGAFYCVTTNQI